MSDFSAPAAGSFPEGFKRWNIPVTWGLVTGLVLVILTTINSMFVLPVSYGAYMIMFLVQSIVLLAMATVAAIRQRTAIGGYIHLRDAFAVIFVVILISYAIQTAYGLVYAKWIDPELGEKVKNGTIGLMESFHAPQDKIRETAAEFDKRLAESTSIKNIFYGYASNLVIFCIFGFIGAFIARRTPKQQAM